MYIGPWRCQKPTIRDSIAPLQNLVVKNLYSEEITLRLTNSCQGTWFFVDPSNYPSFNMNVPCSSPIKIPPNKIFSIQFGDFPTAIEIDGYGPRNSWRITSDQWKPYQNLFFVVNNNDVSSQRFDSTNSVTYWMTMCMGIQLMDLPLKYIGNNQALLGTVSSPSDTDVQVLNDYGIDDSGTSAFIFDLNPPILFPNNCFQKSWTVYANKNDILSFLQTIQTQRFNDKKSFSWRYCPQRQCPPQ